MEAGCNIQLPAWKKVTHEEECPYKGRFEEMKKMNSSIASLSFDESLSDDGSYHDPNEIMNCRYRKFGCMVRMPYHRKRLHEEKCNHRDNDDDESSDESYHDPDELVNCRFRDNGCMVKMPFKRREAHEEKCNHREEDELVYESYTDEFADCRWAKYGCRVRPKLSLSQNHEAKCNYKRDEPSNRFY